MIPFITAIILLIAGYCIYGLLIERVFGIRSARKTPAYTRHDGIDYVLLPTWKVFLIQFLNIAGLGPIFGAIMGIMFGPAAFLWIVIGCIFGGAVHDFICAMMSMRSGGASYPEIIGRELGKPIQMVVRVWTVILLILVGAVFIVNPAGLLALMTPMDKTIWIGIIFLYYILATLLPIDKLIGNLYPVFGVALLFMAVALMGYLFFGNVEIPLSFSDDLGSRHAEYPLFPMMFVSIACGAISGFHATQSPMMVRCLKNEKLARPIFYGAMVAEGLVALIWAAATIAFTNGFNGAEGYDGLREYAAYAKESGAETASLLVKEVSIQWLGTLGGILALMGVIAAPISTGDTALRSTRLMVAEIFKINQSTLIKRLLISLPIFGVTFLIMLIDFNVLWRYFAWCNQTLAVFTLWACTVYLARHGKAYVVTLLPAMFMTAVSVTYILYAPKEGLGIDWFMSVSIGCAVSVACLLAFMWHLRTVKVITPKIAPKLS